MLKIYAFLAKLPQLSDEQFHAHWRDPHGTLTKRIPQFTRYVQNHGVGPQAELEGLEATPFLGIPTIWVRDEQDLAAAQSEPAYAPLDADGDKLYDRSRIAWLMTREHVVVPQDPEPGSARERALVLLSKRESAIGPENCQAAIAALRRSLPDVVGASYALALPEFGDPPFDAVLEIDFADAQALDRDWPQAWASAKDEISAFADLNSSFGFRAVAERVI